MMSNVGSDDKELIKSKPDVVNSVKYRLLELH